MAYRDWMWLEISEAYRARIEVTSAKKFKYTGRALSDATSGKKYGMLKGKDFLVIATGTSIFPGNFKI